MINCSVKSTLLQRHGCQVRKSKIRKLILLISRSKNPRYDLNNRLEVIHFENMRYTSFGIEDNFLILDFFYNTGGNDQHVWTDETNHRNCQSTQTEALQRKKEKRKSFVTASQNKDDDD